MFGKAIRDAVKDRFAKTARQSSSCGCAGEAHRPDGEFIKSASRLAGYSEEELKGVPEGANLGLGYYSPSPAGDACGCAGAHLVLAHQGGGLC